MPLHIEVTESGVLSDMKIITPTVMAAAEKRIRIITIMLAAFIKTTTLPASGLQRRTGAMSRSIVPGKVVRTMDNVTGRVIAGQGLPYPKVHEEGGTITPKNAQYLAIPIGAAKTSAGVARFGPRQAESQGYRTFVHNHIIFGKRGGDNQAEPLFVLKKSVTIPARPFFKPGVRQKRTEISHSLAEALREAIGHLS